MTLEHNVALDITLEHVPLVLLVTSLSILVQVYSKQYKFPIFFKYCLHELDLSRVNPIGAMV
jgi:hypothetical protein